MCISDYVRLLNLSGQVKTARRHHSVVDMQFEFRIEALGNDILLYVFAHLVIFAHWVFFARYLLLTVQWIVIMYHIDGFISGLFSVAIMSHSCCFVLHECSN